VPAYLQPHHERPAGRFFDGELEFSSILALKSREGFTLIDFEQTTLQGGEAALRLAGSFFMKTDPVHETLFRTAKRLDELGIPYAVCGGMALVFHGYLRTTVDVDFLVTAEGLKAIHENLEGRGYLPPFAGSKQLRDTETGVRIEFLVSGGFPGDGLPKPVAFPDPAQAGIAVLKDGLKVVSLELKLASGMTAGHRMKDLGDVQQLIEALDLSLDLANQLNPYVRDRYRELWAALHAARPEWEEPRE
jgi:hypothetical protein